MKWKILNILVVLLPIILFSQKNSELIDYNNYELFIPSSTDNIINHHNHFSYSFNKEHKLSEWTIYFSTKERLTGERFPRKSGFTDDPNLKFDAATKSDYYKSGYDRGHLVPPVDMAFSPLAMKECFYLTNINPQTPSFNGGLNHKIERLIRDWVIEKDSLVIITGSVFKDTKNFTKEEAFYTIGSKLVPVPHYYYKIIIDINEKSSLALLLPNDKTEYENWVEFVCPISTLESITGIDFFYKLPEDLEIDFEDKHTLDD